MLRYSNEELPSNLRRVSDDLGHKVVIVKDFIRHGDSHKVGDKGFLHSGRQYGVYGPTEVPVIYETDECPSPSGTPIECIQAFDEKGNPVKLEDTMDFLWNHHYKY